NNRRSGCGFVTTGHTSGSGVCAVGLRTAGWPIRVWERVTAVRALPRNTRRFIIANRPQCPSVGLLVLLTRISDYSIKLYFLLYIAVRSIVKRTALQWRR